MNEPTLQDWLTMHVSDKDIVSICQSMRAMPGERDLTREEARYVFADRMLKAREATVEVKVW